MITFYWYPGCDNCRRAARWLDGSGVVYERVHLVESTPSAAVLRDLWTRSGLPIRRLFNTSGKSYRDGGYSDRLNEMSDDEAVAALAADGMLIRRPILDTGTRVLFGFRPDEWEEAFD